MGNEGKASLTCIKKFSFVGIRRRVCGLLVGILLFASATAGPLEDAAARLVPLAEGGGAAAQVELGLLYFHGRGVLEDDATAFAWFSRAAGQGYAEGMYHLANMYVFGLGVPPSELDPDQRAAQFYFEAARRSHAAAQHALGILYLTGKGVQKDAGEAAKWFRRAAAQGHAASEPFVEAARR